MAEGEVKELYDMVMRRILYRFDCTEEQFIDLINNDDSRIKNYFTIQFNKYEASTIENLLKFYKWEKVK